MPQVPGLIKGLGVTLGEMGKTMFPKGRGLKSILPAPLAAPVGVLMTCPTPAAGMSRAKRDVIEWCNALQGAAETVDAGATRLGAMVGGRGCVEDLGATPTGDRSLRITVVWQASTPIAAPPEACGAGLYNGPAGSACQGDLCRRAVSTIVRIARLGS